MKPFLAAVTPDELDTWLREDNESSYRGKQILEWIFRHRITDPEAMENIPKSLREKLRNRFACNTVSVLDQKESGDGTRKLLLGLQDGEKIESVIIPSDSRTTFCLSTQVGCPVGCRFCASGATGLVRNLAAGEIVEQFFRTADVHGKLPDNLVFMGIGEGLLNFGNLTMALHRISDPTGVNFGARRITVSTSGWTPGIRKLAALRRAWNLAVSLHAPDDRTRAKIIPETFRKPIREIVEAVIHFRECTQRMVTFEYTLIRGLNDRPDQAEALSQIARECHAKINLIPCNPVSDHPDFQRPNSRTVEIFRSILERNRVPVTLRIEKGGDIAAACGQLRLLAREEP